MQITRQFLVERSACKEGLDWVDDNCKLPMGHEEFVTKLLSGNHFDYANWLLVRLMTHKQQVQYAVHAAKAVIGIYEQYNSSNKAPRKAIEAAEKFISTGSQDDTAAEAEAAEAYAAAEAADAAATYAYVAAADAAATYAANAAASAAEAAASTADDDEAYEAAATAAAAYAANGGKLEKQIIKYGLKLLEE